MRRITISLDDALVELAESEVAAGRAASVSAWVVSAIVAKAEARAELLADLRELERRDPTPARVREAVARALGLSPKAVTRAIQGARSRSKRRAG
jgi:Arc/MetJ-type ribon-helix-helix transcriptional regulator